MKFCESLKFSDSQNLVSKMRFELTQPYGHYPLKVACLPIPPPGLTSSRKRVQK